MLYPSSCDKSTGWCLLVITRSAAQVLTRSAPGTGSCVCKPGVQKCHAGPIYNMTGVCEKGQSSMTPYPYLVAHCPIDNSHSMNGMTKRVNSRAGICACLPCMEDSGEGRQTMTGFLLIFSPSMNHVNIKKKTVSHNVWGKPCSAENMTQFCLMPV